MRRQAREAALQILFQAEFASPVSYMDLMGLFETHLEPESRAYMQSLVEGVRTNQESIDQKIQAKSAHWKLARMAHVDRNVLRIAAYELFFAHEKVSPKIIINEAIEIAKKFGSSDSGSFVNGVLDAIAKDLSWE
jgi:N utilization substance protein B